MSDQAKTIEDLKHLVRYFYQAAHEFFDDASGEVGERAEAIYQCLDKKKNTMEEYRKMIEELVRLQDGLKKKVEDLGFLTVRMKQLLEKK